MPTRSIGEFPKFLPDIVNLINRAKRNLTIFCDYPAYGYFSDYKNWVYYHHAIELQTRTNNIPVNITCLDKTKRQKCREEQFTALGQNWSEWKNRLDIKPQLKNFISTQVSDIDDSYVENLSQENFYLLLEKADQQMLDGTFAAAKKNYLDSYMPLYFWLIDEGDEDATAIFSVPCHNKHLEHGFCTRDPILVSALSDMRDRYHSETSLVNSTTHKPIDHRQK